MATLFYCRPLTCCAAQPSFIDGLSETLGPFLERSDQPTLWSDGMSLVAYNHLRADRNALKEIRDIVVHESKAT
jgi:hypothetical protein